MGGQSGDYVLTLILFLYLREGSCCSKKTYFFKAQNIVFFSISPPLGTIFMDLAVHLKKSRLPLCVHVQHNQSLAEWVGGELKKAQITVLLANGGISHTPN